MPKYVSSSTRYRFSNYLCVWYLVALCFVLCTSAVAKSEQDNVFTVWRKCRCPKEVFGSIQDAFWDAQYILFKFKDAAFFFFYFKYFFKFISSLLVSSFFSYVQLIIEKNLAPCVFYLLPNYLATLWKGPNKILTSWKPCWVPEKKIFLIMKA